MSRLALEETLRTLHLHAVRVGGRPGHETWRFEHAGQNYFARFYARPQRRRFTLGQRAGATREFAGLQTLQRLKIPAPRAVAVLVGFSFGNRRGNLIILDSLGDATSLSAVLTTASPRERATLRDQVIALLKALGTARLGHDALSTDTLIVADGRVYLSDATGIRPGGLKTDHLIAFAQRSWPFVARSDKLRGWRTLVPGSDVPPRDKRPARWLGVEAGLETRAPAAVPEAAVTVALARQAKWFPPARAFDAEAWAMIAPDLIERVRTHALAVLKRDDSGEILTDRLALNDDALDVVIKRPRTKQQWKIYFESRGSRAIRLWSKTAALVARGLPVELPLMRYTARGFYARHRWSFVVFTRVPGPTLAEFDLDTLDAVARENLFRALGRILRRIEDTGLTHFDTKTTNWIITPRPGGGVTPVMIDAYGVRRWNVFNTLAGMERLLRALKQHPQYTPEDSRWLCLGFSPFAKLKMETP